jgi:hypothetical protein
MGRLGGYFAEAAEWGGPPDALAAAGCCLAALYLRGLERPWQPQRRRWPWVLDCLLAEARPLGRSAAALRARGLPEEAALLDVPGLLGAGAGAVSEGRALTAASPSYPPGWREALGSQAPPALWAEGRLPAGRWLAVAGSRRPSPAAVEWAGEAARAAVRLGASVVSGGCWGVDLAAESAALDAGAEGRVVEVLPCGLAACPPAPEGAVRLSACPPAAPFSPGQAAERNALLYAAGRAGLALEPRLGRGGTWQGALDALRRRLAVVGVPEPCLGEGGRALVALGARPMPAGEGAGGAADAVRALLAAYPPVAQPSLFGSGAVREPSPA